MSPVEEKIKKLEKYIKIELQDYQSLSILNELKEAYKEEKERNKHAVLNLFE